VTSTEKHMSVIETILPVFEWSFCSSESLSSLGDFAKLRKGTVSYVTSVRMEQLCSY